jgi:hypothetical protein
VLHDLAIWFGLTNPAGHAYSFWSGVGSDLGEVAIVGAVLGAYHRHNCVHKGCWRIARHQVTDHDGTTHPSCRKHRSHVLDAVRRVLFPL